MALLITFNTSTYASDVIQPLDLKPGYYQVPEAESPENQILDQVLEKIPEAMREQMRSQMKGQIQKAAGQKEAHSFCIKKEHISKPFKVNELLKDKKENSANCRMVVESSNSKGFKAKVLCKHEGVEKPSLFIESTVTNKKEYIVKTKIGQVPADVPKGMDLNFNTNSRYVWMKEDCP